MFSRSPYSCTCLLFIQYYTVFHLYKHIIYPFLSVKSLHCVPSNTAVSFSRTTHSAGWDAHISVQNHEAAHQYHCPDLHSVTAKIIKQVILFTISAIHCYTTQRIIVVLWVVIPCSLHYTQPRKLQSHLHCHENLKQLSVLSMRSFHCVDNSHRYCVFYVFQ
jgi:hypothetical protein